MSDQTEHRVRRVLEHELAQVDTAPAADAVLDRVEQLAGDATEQDAAQAAAAAVAPPGADPRPDSVGRAATAAIVDAARSAPGQDGVAAALLETAAQAVAPTPAADAVTRGVQAAVGAAVPSPPASDQGRRLLQEAALRRMDRRDSLDARIFLAINGAPHPRWLDRLTDGVTVVTHGGWVWLLGLVIARLLGQRGRGPDLFEATVCIAGATGLVEYPIKAFFRRQRPFVAVIRAIVVGKKPGSWSFPSGHTASSFAAATVCASCWPRRAPLFFGLAGVVGLSRVYAGAHYPGDVLSGAFLGVTLVGTIRTALRTARGQPLVEPAAELLPRRR